MPPAWDARANITQVTNTWPYKEFVPSAHSPPGPAAHHVLATRCPPLTMCLTPTMHPMPAAHHVPTAYHTSAQTGCPVRTAPWCPPLLFLHYLPVPECHVIASCCVPVLPDPMQKTLNQILYQISHHAVSLKYACFLLPLSAPLP